MLGNVDPGHARRAALRFVWFVGSYGTLQVLFGAEIRSAIGGGLIFGSIMGFLDLRWKLFDRTNKN